MSRWRGRGALLDRQRLGERLDQHFAERQAHRLDPLELRLVDRRQMRDDVAHHRAGDQQVDGGDRVLTAVGRLAVPAASRVSDVDELRRRVEVADEQQILDQRDDRRHQLAPALVVLLDAQQVEHQRQVERAQRRVVATVDEPRADALGRIVADLFDVDRLRARARELACRTRRRRTTCRCTTSAASPRRGPRRLRSRRCCRAATRRRPSCASASSRSRSSLVLDERLERLRQAIGRRR